MYIVYRDNKLNIVAMFVDEKNAIIHTRMNEDTDYYWVETDWAALLSKHQPI